MRRDAYPGVLGQLALAFVPAAPLPALCVCRRIAPPHDCRLHMLIAELASFGMEPHGPSGFLYILIHVSLFDVPIKVVSNWFHY